MARIQDPVQGLCIGMRWKEKWNFFFSSESLYVLNILKVLVLSENPVHSEHVALGPEDSFL